MSKEQQLKEIGDLIHPVPKKEGLAKKFEVIESDMGRPTSVIEKEIIIPEKVITYRTRDHYHPDAPIRERKNLTLHPQILEYVESKHYQCRINKGLIFDAAVAFFFKETKDMGNKEFREFVLRLCKPS